MMKKLIEKNLTIFASKPLQLAGNSSIIEQDLEQEVYDNVPVFACGI